MAADQPPSIEELTELLGEVWLYINWRYVTKQLDRHKKTIFADAVDAWSAKLGIDTEGPVADRWWEDEK